MALLAGARLGPYEVLAPLGAGGMGEVYRAKDTRLGRIVAIKVLPSSFAADPMRRARFEREARAVSSLSHPHICTLHDIGQQDGIDYIVMEHLEGQTLAERLEKGPLSTEQLLRLGTEIADALDKAHRQGIVHRDLKPANVMLTKSGAKLLDFGLAKFEVPQVGFDGLSALDTRAKPLTGEGTLLGTFQYMAPEQLEGKEADARTDIFALGSILYEMATGQRAFVGKSQTSLIAAILEKEPPPILSLQPRAPLALERLVNVCLDKDPDERWQTAHDLRIQLLQIGQAPSGGDSHEGTSSTWHERFGWGALVVALLLVALLGWLRLPLRGPELRSFRFNIELPPRLAGGGSVLVSPGGQQIVFSASDRSGRSQLYVRELATLENRALPGTEEGVQPFWSPDGQRLGFFSHTKLRTMDLSGGHAIDLADVGTGFAGGAWTPDNRIVVGSYGKGLRWIPPGGGQLTPVRVGGASPAQDKSGRWPHLLPDGKHLVFLSARRAEPEASTIDVIGTDGTGQRTLVAANSEAFFAGGFLLYARDGALMAQRFDPLQLVLSGDPAVVQDPVVYNGLFGSVDASASGDVLAYRPFSRPSVSLTWFDRSGKEVSTVGPSGPFAHVDVSPDAVHFAVERIDPHNGSGEIWVGDLLRGTLSRVTGGSDWNWMPVWSADGTRLVFSSTRSHVSDLYVKGQGGMGPEELLLEDPSRLAPDDWSRDGRHLVVQKLTPTGYELWRLTLDLEKKLDPLVLGDGRKGQARFSPDGHFLAYSSNEGGTYEIFVAPVPPTGAKWQVSPRGGFDPRWRADGRELFYIAPDRDLMAVPVTLAQSFHAGVPARLFRTRLTESGRGLSRRAYAPSVDGSRFLMLTVAEEQFSSPTTVVIGWGNAVSR